MFNPFIVVRSRAPLPIGFTMLLATIRYSLGYSGVLPDSAYETATEENLKVLLNAIRGTSFFPDQTQEAAAQDVLGQTSENLWEPVQRNGIIMPRWSHNLTLNQEETFQARPSIRIVMPDNIKSLIVDDWERVTKNGSVVQLPHAKSVYQILQDWRAEELPKRHHVDVSVMDEVIAGLSEYFEVVIDKLLLYRYERHQYRVLKKKYFNNKDKTPLHVYGAEHLIRLMSLLPELLAQTNMEYKSTGRSHEELSKFSIWLSRNSEKYFLTKYVPANEIDEED
ncbi:Chromatin modification-related protein eaf3 [Penicillium frequentans]|nr:Chromatin modification-related protein eaf3 [Penicillium glabrum]